MDDVPANIKSTAILQLVSGIITVTFMACVSYLTIGTTLAVCTFFIGGLGGICGLVGLLLVPVGIFEIVSGILGLTNPKAGAKVMQICSYVEMGSILLGGLSTAIAGGVALAMMNNPEVKAYLEG